MTIGAWKPGIGDPSFMGWFTVFSYYLVASLCLLKMISRTLLPGKKAWLFWAFMCLAMIVLGVIKQYNLLSAVTEVWRIIARHCGWMEQRWIIQAAAMILFFVISMIFSSFLYRRSLQLFSVQEKIAAFGLVYLILFVGLRAISLHQYGTVLGYEIWGMRINWIAELFGIYWICFAIFWTRLRIGER
jgi:membrane-anchored protein YejM (alkaline phosphatase superfamily)